jgi:hypothetical protein
MKAPPSSPVDVVPSHEVVLDEPPPDEDELLEEPPDDDVLLEEPPGLPVLPAPSADPSPAPRVMR